MFVPATAEAARTSTPLNPEPKLTLVYSSQLAELIQPTSLPPPVSAVASVPVEFCAAYCEAVTVIVPEPPPVDVPLGIFHCCWVESAQVSMSSLELVLPPGSVRQSPEFGFTSSPLD